MCIEWLRAFPPYIHTPIYYGTTDIKKHGKHAYSIIYILTLL